MSDVNEMRNLMNKFEKLINDNKGKVEESGFPSLATKMRGLRPSIKTIAILTTENSSRDYELSSYLRERFYFYKEIYRSSSGSMESDVEENSFIIFNIPLDVAIGLENNYEQDSIIYGETGNVAENGEIAMTFKMIGLDKTKPDEYKNEIGKINVFMNRDNSENFFGRIGNRKFIIPFSGVVDNLIDKDGKFFDLYKYYKDTKWEAGTERATNYSEYEINEQFGELENHLNYLAEGLMEAEFGGSSGFNLRGQMNDIING
ncbi:hypothetical protein MCERE19_01175 [Spirosomataceae bacterium]